MNDAPFNVTADADDAAVSNGSMSRKPLTVPDPDDPTKRVMGIVDPESGDVVSALHWARLKLTLPELVGVVNYSAEVPRFALVLDDGRKLLVGGTPDLRSPTKVCDLIADAVNKYPPVIKTEPFRHIANALRAIAVLDDSGASPTDETRAWLRGFCKERITRDIDPDSDKGRTEAVHGSTEPFLTPDGHLYVYALDLANYVRMLRIHTVTLPEITDRLRAIGFTKDIISAPRDGGKPTKRKWWRSPDDFDHQTGQ
jgi:hypothetical protein